MKLYRLSFSGIGPFRDRVELNFEALADGGLFLIEGATGSGKSTIIDAISYALYGSVLGSGSKARMTSDFRDLGEDAPPFVELTFETGQGLWRVRREPEHKRLKLRGEGERAIDATADLFEITAEQIDTPTSALPQVPAATGPRDVNIRVPEIVGLNASQFAQTIVLPQGQFTTFLESKDDERRVILERLFDTGLYSRVVEVLTRRQAEADSRFAQIESDLRDMVNRFLEAAGAEGDPEMLDLVSRPADLRQRTAAALASLQAVARRDSEAAATAKVARDDADRAHDELVRRRGLVAERREADREQARLREQASRVAEAEDALAALARAAVPQERRADVALREQEAVKAQDDLDAVVTGHPELRAVDAGEAERRREVLLREAGALGELVSLESGLPAREQELARSSEALEEQRQRVAGLEAKVESLPGRVDELTQELNATRLEAGMVGERARALGEAQTRLGQARKAEGLRGREPELERSAAASLAAARAAKDTMDELHAAFLQSAAAELALTLESGSACLVCGSTDHPRPAGAQVAGRAVTRAELELAKKRLDDADTDLRSQSEELRQLKSEAEWLEQVVGRPVAQALAEVAAAQAEVTAAEEARTRVDRLESELAESRTELRTVADDLQEAKGLAVRAQTRLEADQASLSRDRQVIDAERGDHASVAVMVSAKRAEASALAELASALRAVDGAADALAQARDAAAKALVDAGFADVAALEAALANGPRSNELDTLVTQHRSALAAVRRDLERLAGVDPREEVDPEPAHQELERADQAHSAAASSAAISAAAAKAAAEHSTAISRLCTRLEADRAAAQTLIDLTRLVQGGNRNISLPLFVVIRRFREVVEAANSHLGSMLGGRLTLVSHSEQVDGRARYGLGLRVVDGLSGFERDTRSVSGGEAFCCALALALGLAEVVLLESGGLRADTLFVDEGFGSLDAQTLQQVIDELDELRDGGRMVGVVSHVSSMHEQIHRQIRVSRTDDGPSVVTLSGI